MPSMTIEKAQCADAATILAIQKRAFAEEGRICNDWDIPPLTEALESVADHIQHQTALVARDGADIVGSVRGIALGTVCMIKGLSIEPARQGEGIGSALLAAIEAAHPRVARFELTTNAVMKSNVRFYERHGYRVDEFTQHTDTITLAQMSKAAAAQARACNPVGERPWP